MGSVKETIKIYTNAIQIPSENICDLAMEIFKFLNGLGTNEINSNMNDVAELFCNTLSKVRETDLDCLQDLIFNSYLNIRRMKYNENSNNDSYFSNIIVINFLNKLNDMVEGEINFNVIDEKLHKQFKDLSENLENIKIIFKIRINNKEMFPIGKLLSNVIESDSFSFDVLDISTLNTLLLALEVFKIEEYHDEKDKLKKLIEECNIKCLSYLENSHVERVGGKAWKMNFKKNGILILNNVMTREILIRHEDKSYFSNLSENIDLDIKDEKNKSGKRIASYCEYTYKDSEELCSIEEIILSGDKEKKKNLLKLIYNKKNYNCFFDRAFLVDGVNIRIINPFTFNDRDIVMGKNDKDVLFPSVKNVTDECMRRYWLELFYDINLNCASIGLICNLLTIEDVDVDLVCKNIDDNECFQNQFIKNWILLTENPIKSLITVQTKFFESLSYCEKIKLTESKMFYELYLYPIEFSSSIVDILLKNEYIEEYNIELNFEKLKYIIDFNEEKNILDLESNIINNENIIYKDCDEFDNDQEIYSVRVDGDKWLISEDINMLGIIKSKIDYDNKKLISFDMLKMFENSQINYVEKYMELHEKALLDQTNVNINFKSMVKFRLISNIIVYQIFTKEKWGNFLQILGFHKKVSFESIKDIVKLSDKGILYVPKEKQESDSVLTSIINNYLKNDSVRNIDFYNNELNMLNSKYCLRGYEINQIVILFDTLQNGTSTKRTLDFYFFHPDKEDRKNKTIKYFTDGKQVHLTDIIEKNNASLKICFINATEEGEAVIKEYFKEKKIEVTIECQNYIKNCVDSKLIELCESVYSKCHMEEGYYPIIREFNQPKKNVFPPSMLESNKIYSLFVKKTEHKV